MNQKFDLARNVYVDLDSHGTVRQLLHSHDPVEIKAATPQIAAATYLNQFGDILGLSANQLENLSSFPSSGLEDSSVEYRFYKEKHQFDSATVAFHQTVLGIPVWEAGISVQMMIDPFRILTSQSTRHSDLQVESPSRDKVKELLAIGEEYFGKLLGIWSKPKNNFVPDPESLKIEDRKLFIYRYENAKRVPGSNSQQQPPIGMVAEKQLSSFYSDLPTLPLPPVSKNIREGQHYVCVKIDFSLSGSPIGLLHWVALVEVESQSVLYLRPYVDHVNGMVFEVDPVTNNGSPLPSANNTFLNPVRVSTILPGLVAPSGGIQSLTGNNIELKDIEQPPTISIPAEPSGTDFNYNARTNDFSAVNAYYHCDKFFRILDSMGFTQTNYFGETAFPSPVDHRGKMNTSDGIEINAHCLGNSGGHGIKQTTFAFADLGDTANPLGIACDHRVVLHELGGHGVLYNHVNSANFRFSHSAGDSIAAILNDPGSQATDRFQTFPWMYNDVNRRHDRSPGSGWGYSGNIALHPFDYTLDRGGYNNEQILSSTHFRIYRSIGGDSTELIMKRFAARMATYLILRAIATLTPATSPATADGWVAALLTADRGDWISENITGGAYSKLIRWAFEKQGLYQPTGTPVPNDSEGVPPAVDVYIDDGRSGEYQYQANWWSCQKIWNRRSNDGGSTHEEPVTFKTNYAFVKIKNRGSQNATNVIVKGYHANPAAGLKYPIDWSPMNTSQLTAADVPANKTVEITVGPFEWIPTHVGHECMFMLVSATGDPSNVDRIDPGDSIPEWRLVPHDNNIGQRNVYPVSGGGTSGLIADINRLSFQLKNPHTHTASMETRVKLPSFLEERGWKVQFLNQGGWAFPLSTGESRNISIKLVPGKDFTPADLESSSDRTIQIYGYAGGILVGGMSYILDPNLKPSKNGGEEHKCVEIAEGLINCIGLNDRRICKIRIRKINVDLVFEDHCDECDA